MAIRIRKAEDILRSRVKLKTLDSMTKTDIVVLDGKDGKSGSDGRDGRDGRDGIGLTWRGDWSPNETYHRNDIVRYQGATYIMTGNTAIAERPSSASTLWSTMTEAAAKAPPQVIGGGPNVGTRYTLVTNTEYTVRGSSLVNGYNIFEVDAGGETTINIPRSIDDSKFIIIKNSMVGFNVTTQAV